MILVIKTNEELLHDLEFVKPIEDILENSSIKFFTKHYNALTKKDLEKSSKLIICGTSLQDNQISKSVKKFEFLKNYEKPILGICAGMQIMGVVFGGKLKKGKEIGFYREKFQKDFLGIRKNSELEVYHLHNYNVSLPREFENYAKNVKISQAIKHKTKEIYGVLFHPEVRNKELIKNFCKI